MPTVFHIDTLQVANHRQRLEEMSRSAIPVVVRQTLNAAAFRVKTETMPMESKIFTERKPTFFKANSKVDPAKGMDINTMVATVGFIPKPADKSHSVEDLQEQEYGGSIENRSFIALAGARQGDAWQGLTLANKRRKGSNIGGKPVFDSKDAPGSNDKQKFIKSAYEAQKVGGIVIGNIVNNKGNKIAWSIQKSFGHSGGRMVMSFNKKFVETQIFSVKKDRKVHPHATHFMKKASDEAQQEMEMDFVKFANARLNKMK